MAHSQFGQVTRPQLAVDREIEHRKITGCRPELQLDPDSPDFPGLQRRLLPGQLVSVPWHARAAAVGCRFLDDLLSTEEWPSLLQPSVDKSDPLSSFGSAPCRRRFVKYNGRSCRRLSVHG